MYDRPVQTLVGLVVAAGLIVARVVMIRRNDERSRLAGWALIALVFLVPVVVSLVWWALFSEGDI